MAERTRAGLDAARRRGRVGGRKRRMTPGFPWRPKAMSDVTRILSAIERGDPGRPSDSCPWSTTSCAAWPRRSSPQEKPGQTLQATALVHEAYLRLVGDQDPAGTAAATSSPPRPRPCAASWSSTPATGGG